MVSRGRAGRSIPGKILVSLFFLPFLGLGLWLTYLMVQGMIDQFETYSWPRLTCTVISSQVEEHPGSPNPDEAYVFKVRYRWSADFAEGSSETYRHGYRGSADIGDALRLAREYPPGAEVPCWVNPNTPNSAILAFESPWNVLWILFPLLFAAVGAGGIIFVWRKPSPKPGRLRTAISSRASTQMGSPGCLAAFFSVFLLFGLGFLIPFFVMPLVQGWSASEWLEVPCVIEYSAIRSHSSDDGYTYSIDVLYSYEIDGQRFKSSRYDFFTGSDSSYNPKRDFVDRHPAGTRTICYVNPNDPLDAVLQRSSYAQALWGLIPMVFVIVGGAGVAWALFSWFKGSGGRSRQRSEASRFTGISRAGTAPTSGPLVLEASATPLGKLMGATAIALFWNGITGLFVGIAIANWDSGEGMGCLALFLIPFVLIGLMLLVNVPYQLLAMFNPRPQLTLDQLRLVLGSDALLTWRFKGAVRRIRQLKITLEGTESVTYRRGTNTRTESGTFATIPVVDRPGSAALASGQAQIQIPSDTMHSFAAPHNRIVWRLKLRGEIRGWPDVLEEFELQVEPGK